MVTHVRGSTLHTTSEHGVSSITTADAHTSAASSRLNWRPPADLNGLVRFAWKTKSGFCACAITFQLASTKNVRLRSDYHMMGPLKETLYGRRFAIEDEVKDVLRAGLLLQPWTFFADGIRTFVKRVTKWMTVFTKWYNLHLSQK